MNLNPKSWIEGIIFRKVVMKVTKGATAAALGILTSQAMEDQIAPAINDLIRRCAEFGVHVSVQVDKEAMQAAVTSLVAGLVLGGANIIKRRLDVDRAKNAPTSLPPL